MTPDQQINSLLSRYQIEQYGVCSYEKISGLLPCRNAVRIPQNAKSVIVCAFPYLTPLGGNTNLCAYARVPDYHDVVGKILEELCSELRCLFPNSFEAFTDISALPEKECALSAGIGFPGENGLVINPVYGTYFVIGEIVTDLPLPHSQPLEMECLHCGACTRHCPAGAIGSGGIDYQRCLSQVTQRKGALTEAEIQLIQQNGLVWGCDSCQICCPHNRDAALTHLSAFAAQVEPVLTYDNLAELMKTRAFGYRGKQLMLRNLSLFDPPNNPEASE